jgi:hypothetical protein
MGISLHRGSVGNLEWVCLPRFLKEKENAYLGSFVIDPEDIKILNLGTIWNFGEGTGLS